MLIDRFVNVLSAILSLTGVTFLLKGILRLSPDLIAKISQTHLDFNLLQIQNLASQKADFVSGAALVLIAFLIQMFAVLFFREPFPIFDDYWSAAGVVIAVRVVIAIVFFGVYRRKSMHLHEQHKIT